MKIGFCIGVFDMFHYGHLKLIERAAEQCGHLVVAVVKDEAVRAQKGEGRPVIPFDQRIAIIKGLKAVDDVVPSESFDPYQAVLDYGIVNIYFKGADQQHVPTDRIEELGIKIVMLDRTPDVSTTKIIERMK